MMINPTDEVYALVSIMKSKSPLQHEQLGEWFRDTLKYLNVKLSREEKDIVIHRYQGAVSLMARFVQMWENPDEQLRRIKESKETDERIGKASS